MTSIEISEIENLNLDNIVLKKQIGHGANGVVYKVYHKIYKKEYALKVIKSEMDISKKFIEEVSKNKKISSKEIGIVESTDSFIIEKDDYYYYFYLMEYLDDCVTLEKYIEHSKFRGKGNFIALARNILYTLRNISFFEVYHGDLHTENILIDSDNKHYIIDFGTSIFVRENYGNLRSCLLIVDTMEKLFDGIFYPESLYPNEIRWLKDYTNNGNKGWQELKKHPCINFYKRRLNPDYIIEFYLFKIETIIMKNLVLPNINWINNRISDSTSIISINTYASNYIKTARISLLSYLVYFLENEKYNDNQISTIITTVVSSVINGGELFSIMNDDMDKYSDEQIEIWEDFRENYTEEKFINALKVLGLSFEFNLDMTDKLAIIALSNITKISYRDHDYYKKFLSVYHSIMGDKENYILDSISIE